MSLKDVWKHVGTCANCGKKEYWLVIVDEEDGQVLAQPSNQRKCDGGCTTAQVDAAEALDSDS